MIIVISHFDHQSTGDQRDDAEGERETVGARLVTEQIVVAGRTTYHLFRYNKHSVRGMR